MKVYAIFNKEQELIACFPTEEQARNYGIGAFGADAGWNYNVVCKWLYDSPYMMTTTPYTTNPPSYVTYNPLANYSVRASDS